MSKKQKGVVAEAQAEAFLESDLTPDHFFRTVALLAAAILKSCEGSRSQDVVEVAEVFEEYLKEGGPNK